MTTCSVHSCSSPARRRGWCSAHYQRWWKTGDPLAQRPGRWDDYERPACSVEGCENPAHAHGLCSVHAPRARRHGDPTTGRRLVSTGTDHARFLSFIQPAGGCWLWTGATTSGGYAEFQVDGATVYAHRWSYEHHVGHIPADLEIDHVCHSIDQHCPGGVCDHRRCVNPAHLEPVTTVENQRRSRERSL